MPFWVSVGGFSGGEAVSTIGVGAVPVVLVTPNADSSSGESDVLGSALSPGRGDMDSVI